MPTYPRVRAKNDATDSTAAFAQKGLLFGATYIPSVTAGQVVLDVTSPWGISASTGIAYYDDAGAAAADIAMATIDSNGRMILSTIGR